MKIINHAKAIIDEILAQEKALEPILNGEPDEQLNFNSRDCGN